MKASLIFMWIVRTKTGHQLLNLFSRYPSILPTALRNWVCINAYLYTIETEAIFLRKISESDKDKKEFWEKLLERIKKSQRSMKYQLTRSGIPIPGE